MTENASTTADSTIEAIAVDRAARVAADVVDNVERVIVGQRAAVEGVLVGVLARGHVLLEDVPGVGKTMLARSLARSIDCSFKRVQFTPDLLPGDITGVNVYNRGTGEFEFQPGPVFANVVLGDEINRAPPKTQSALLEAMEEAQVTVDGETRPLPQPFTVIATQNDVEPGRTYELPIAEVDRFTKKLRLGYPEPDDEIEILDRAVGTHPIEDLTPVTDTETVRRLRATTAGVTVAEPIRSYAADLAAHTREHATLGVSPRGTIALLRSAQARAVIEGRDHVLPDDIQREAETTLAHRIRRSGDAGPEAGRRLVADAIDAVRVP